MTRGFSHIAFPLLFVVFVGQQQVAHLHRTTTPDWTPVRTAESLQVSSRTNLRGASSGHILPIEPVVQQTYVWCWVAVGEMVFRHYGHANVNPFGNYQCGIVGLLADGTEAQACASDCRFCVVPAGSAANFERMLELYPQKLRWTGRSSPLLEFDYESRALSFQEVDAELAQNRPVVAGISPSGRPGGTQGSQHVALIVGTRVSRGIEELLINDPYPFADTDNPYARARARVRRPGSYWISVENFVGSLNWRETFRVRPIGDAPIDARELRAIDLEDSRQQCVDRCEAQSWDCGDDLSLECILRQQNRRDAVACGCPNWRRGDLRCYAVCDDVYQKARLCPGRAVSTCERERRTCEARCR